MLDQGFLDSGIIRRKWFVGSASHCSNTGNIQVVFVDLDDLDVTREDKHVCWHHGLGEGNHPKNGSLQVCETLIVIAWSD